jgi:tRNA (guanosine-2'-O-)-methyltransferase
MKSNLRIKADNAKKFRCKNLIVVLENPKTIENIGSTLRNVDALGAEKLYVVDGSKLLPESWDKMTNRMKEFEPYISKNTTAHTGYWDV